MRGHEEASGTKYVPKEVMEYWSKKDPVITYENFLIEEKIYSEDEISVIKEETKKEVNTAVKESFDGKEFNVNSPQQLAEILFDDLGLRQIKKRSTAVEVLEALKSHHPLPEIVLEYRHLNKLKTTYLDGIPKFLNQKSNNRLVKLFVDISSPIYF